MSRYSSTFNQSVIAKALGLMAVAGATAGILATHASATEQQVNEPTSDVAATYGDVGVKDIDPGLP
jgi:hypothetical protein